MAFGFACFAGRFSVTHGQATPPPIPPVIASASDEAENAMHVFLLPDGVTASLFAAEPAVANPVAIDVDPHNRVFVCESYRQEKGVEDNRNHPEWLQEDLAAQTVTDRLNYIRKHLADEAIRYTQQDDRIRLLIDTDGDGVADQSTVFADRFNGIEEGTGAGVLFWRGDVFYTCIPRLWKLVDNNDDGTADNRVALQDGFGVRFAFRGHDLHGLIVGPDGRLYFSIGDRGYHIGDNIADPESGAVFRCDLDGSNLEVIATGLRNPQELAFDNFGNLFTGDNNSDSGDKARMVYVVEGSDTGWRMPYQYLPDRGPFNREKIWHPYDSETTPAYIVPPINNFADGPSGFAFYPGSGFSDHMIDRFLLCDFRGQTSGSGIKTFRLKPKGAFFEIADEENTFWNILATDCCFGPDGRLYVSDWVHGWDGIGKGRIYAFSDRNANIELKRQVKQLLSSNWSSTSPAKLVSLLGHVDRRIRMQAQFELARRRADVELNVIARSANSKQIARIHAIWALDQIWRSGEASANFAKRFAELLSSLLDGKDVELQNQSSRLIGNLLSNPGSIEIPQQEIVAKLTRLMRSKNARTRYFAAITLGKIGTDRTVEPILELLADNNNADPLIRHAGIMALVYQWNKSNFNLLTQATSHESMAVRLAAVVTLRKVSGESSLREDLMGRLLDDSDDRVLLETARAVHDLPVIGLLPELAEFASRPSMSDAMSRRVLNANFRIGDTESIERVKNFVIDDSQLLDRRIEAVQLLSEWSSPPSLDKVLGKYAPIDMARRSSAAKLAVDALFVNFDSFNPEIGNALINAAIVLQVESAIPVLRRIFEDGSEIAAREKALRGLLSIGSENIQPVVTRAMFSKTPEFRILALNYLTRHGHENAADEIARAIKSESTPERQNAIAILGRLNTKKTRVMIRNLLQQMHDLQEDSQLDVVLAAEATGDGALRQLVEKTLSTSGSNDSDRRYSMTKLGGNADRGARIFFERTDVSCLRCHKINGSGGDVGPDLSDIGSKRDRQFILESLINPNKIITENFETIVVLDVNGKIHIGVPKASDDNVLSIMTAEAILVSIPVDDIEDTRRGESSMPDDVTEHLTLSELRDLIEFLATRKE